MKIHVDTLFTHDAGMGLLLVNEPGGAPAARFFLGRTHAGNVCRFRSGLPDSLMAQLQALADREPVSGNLQEKPKYFDEYIRLLQAHAPVRRLWMGPAFYIPVVDAISPGLVRINQENSGILSNGFGDWIDEVADRQPFLARLQEKQAISICCSVRITHLAHEAGVETLGDFRGRGFAMQVVAGWASAVREKGAIPIYSTSWENESSRRVAEKLSLALYGADFHVT